MTIRRRCLSLGLLLAPCAGAVPLAAAAQDGGLPTLRDLGVEYISPTGLVQLGFSGRLDVEGYVPSAEPAWLIPETDGFVTGRARLFADLFVGASLYGTLELRADGGEAPRAGAAEARVEQAFLRWTASPLLGVQAGKFASPFGSYPTRHHTDEDPLIRPPLPYEWRTMVSTLLVPANSGAFIAWKDEPEQFRPYGAPPVWGTPYQWGALVLGSWRGGSWTVAVLNSAPSSEPEAWAWDPARFEHPSLVASLGWQLAPWLRATVYYDRGPYVEPDAMGPIPPGAALSDYDQILWGAEAVFQLGHTGVRAEAFHDRWEVPNVAEDPIDVSYSVEATRTLAPGLFVAARYGAIHFNHIPFRSAGYTGPGPEGIDAWDYDTRRVQVGGGYRLLRNVEARAEYMWNVSHGPADPDDDLLSVQLWWQF